MEHPLSPYQLLFFNRELNFGSPKSNILKGNVSISGADYSKLKTAIIDVLKDAEWTYLSINVNEKSWDKREDWNGSFQEKIVEPEISLEGKLWSVQLIQESENNILLRLCLHHCLGDAHSFNLFWNSVYTRYKSGALVKLDSLRETASEISILPTQEETKELPVDLGIGTIKRLSYHFNSRVLNHLNTIATEKSGSIMAFVLDQLETELSVIEKHLEIPLIIGIALRNRKNKFQKNSFPTYVNFLPLINEDLPMRQRILNVFRYQEYPLLDYLVKNKQRVAFNVLFSYQKESYEFSDNLGLNFNFEPSSADDNILGIHLLEYGNDLLIVHVDYRTDIASEHYWKTFIRSIIRKISAIALSQSEIKKIYNDSKLVPSACTIENIDFWHWFDHVENSKLALVCEKVNVSFGELKRRIEEIQFEENERLVKLKPERTLENIVHLLAAWSKGLAISYHDVNENCLENAENIAYVAKTSGTSGKSKTILISFDSLKTLIPDWKRIYQTKVSVHLSLADQRFDVFFGDLLRSVLSGETLVFATDEERLDAKKISNLIKEFNVTHLESTPSFLGYLLPNLNKIDSLKTIICGSEPILDSFYRITQKNEFNQIQFFNSYGLTECSIDSTVSKLKKTNEGKFPSGFVVGDQTITIQDKSGALKPMGVWGEVHIEGECVGINVESNNRNKKYATGDLGMISPRDGLIVGGRINNDFIKVNGRRIPAGLIESLVSQIDKVQACLCLEFRNSAVLIVKGDSNEDEIKQLLSSTLSKYQLPDTYFFSETWPINQNGKADRDQLIEWYQNSFELRPTWQPNGDSKQQILHDCLVARNKSFGSENESLISFGWNSIELLSLANELNLKGLFVPLTSFIQNPTIYFILESIDREMNNSTTEKPEADDFDIDDILSVLND
jgi:acyl-CoA synthetase (AMP-forming)/AMP-acid ligase II/aryl carrier-like protein